MAAERVAPNDLITQTNLSGSITDIDDDPDSPDGNWLTAIDNEADVFALVGFATPASTPLAGDGLQEFKIQVRKSAAAGNKHPILGITLYESGSAIIVLLAGLEVTNATSQIVTVTWDMVVLPLANPGISDETGAGIEIGITGQAISGGSPSQRRTVEIGAVEWNAETGVNDGFID